MKMGPNYRHAVVQLAPTAEAAEKAFKAARRSGRVAVI